MSWGREHPNENVERLRQLAKERTPSLPGHLGKLHARIQESRRMEREGVHSQVEDDEGRTWGPGSNIGK